jgi:hypothetical protein
MEPIPESPVAISSHPDQTETTTNNLAKLIELRLRQLREEPKPYSTSLFSKVVDMETPISADLTGNQPLAAGTSPECDRNFAETPPKNPARSAGTPKERKRRVTESPLDDLPAETQQLILQILERCTLNEATAEITSKSYGLGIQTSRSSLHRFFERHKVAKITSHRRQIAAEAAKILAESKNHGDLTSTAAHLIELRLLETAVAERPDAQNVLALSRSLDRLRSIDLAERRLRLAEQKLNPPQTAK